ncbi:MAG: hypothetical protein LJE64_05470 [Desulfofustis sp.]|nr:hypothetical protein [Desulfofustis sp.]
MDLYKQIGSLLMVGFPGAELSETQPISRDIVEFGLGGVILFNRCLHDPSRSANISSAVQLRELCRSLQELAGGRLLIGVDQEGGAVRRLRPEAGFAEVCSASSMGAASDTGRTREAARITAQMLSEAGCTINFAPVVDIDVNADNPVIGALGRSFSDDPARVAAHAATWIKAHRERSILSCVKHFPGHGSSSSDSHLGFVDVTDSWSELELIPYRDLYSRNLIDAVMTGHLYNRRIDPDFPATMSTRTISGLLRSEIGYDGVVFSDDLQMRAIAGRYPFEEAVCRTLAAGVDILVFGNNLDYDPDICPKTIEAVVAGINAGRVSEAILEHALRRVRRLKRKMTVRT